MILIVYSEVERARELAEVMAARLGERVRVVQRPLAEIMSIAGFARTSCSLVVTVGGDGTLLRTATLCPPNVPILGVNMGHLGYLAASHARTVDYALAHVERALRGETKPLPRMRLKATVSMSQHSKEYLVLNDVVLDAARTSMITFRMFADENEVTEYRSDGLIIATPTGSTAYNLSAGGPILMPCVKAIVVTAICPHNLNNRPIVLNPETRLRVALSASNRAERAKLSFDGVVVGFPSYATLSVEAGPPLLLYHDVDPFEVLRTRLHWS